MAKPFLTLALSDDGNSVFVYSGDITRDEQELEACIGMQRADADEQLINWTDSLIRRYVK